MNIIESAIMSALEKAVKAMFNGEGEELDGMVASNRMALKSVESIDPVRLRGMVMLAVSERTDENGQEGLHLETSMVGSVAVIGTLLRGGAALLEVQQLSEARKSGEVNSSVVDALLDGTSTTSSTVCVRAQTPRSVP